MLSPFRIHFHFHCAEKRLRLTRFPTTLFRVLIICCRLTIRSPTSVFVIGICFAFLWLSSFPLFARLIYFGSLLKAAAVILITIYLFISYLPNGIVWSHAPPPHCQLNFLLAAGTQSIPLLFSFARAKFVWEELAVKKRLELCSVPVALGTHSQRARGKCSKSMWSRLHCQCL